MPTISGNDVKKVVVACDAGMGSSVLLASTLKKQLAPYSVSVDHTPVNSIPDDADVVLCHAGLLARARSVVPEKVVLPFQVFLGDPVFTKVVNTVRDGAPIEA